MNGSYTAKYLQSEDTILLPMQKAGSEFRRMAGSIGNIGMVVVVGKWTELSQSQVLFVPESKSPFPMFFYMWYIMDPTLFLLITGVVPCECNTFLYIERPTFSNNPNISGQFYGNCKENKVNGIRGCYVNPGSSCHDAKPSVIGSPYRWSVEACKLREEQQQKG